MVLDRAKSRIQDFSIGNQEAQKAVWLKPKIIHFDHWPEADIAELLSPFVKSRMSKIETDIFCILYLFVSCLYVNFGNI